ncbi:hypothetical protein CALVIDRAFT_485141 [Calocera viscosa TUFC12733]|uniref:Uncharacterized protein n=1 Tax=Calocera viscosa (strain TUFC12733) TaxID=1330018 RepID=A0A167JVF4_CALVF|nr:hypothetical protein CALVIDRAFT_485141 [Calocera viscosa TUFC12733]
MYEPAIDIRSIVRICEERSGTKPFFKGKDYVDQRNERLFDLAWPFRRALQSFGARLPRRNIFSLPINARISFQSVHPCENPSQSTCAQKLWFDPARRISCEKTPGTPVPRRVARRGGRARLRPAFHRREH